MAASCEQCGVPIEAPRNGSQPKRFCSSSCRGKAHRGRPKAQKVEPRARITPERRLRDLEEIYEMLLATVRRDGNGPAIDRLLKVSAEIGRLGVAPPVEVEEDILLAVAA